MAVMGVSRVPGVAMGADVGAVVGVAVGLVKWLPGRVARVALDPTEGSLGKARREALRMALGVAVTVFVGGRHCFASEAGAACPQSQECSKRAATAIGREARVLLMAKFRPPRKIAAFHSSSPQAEPVGSVAMFNKEGGRQAKRSSATPFGCACQFLAIVGRRLTARLPRTRRHMRVGEEGARPLAVIVLAAGHVFLGPCRSTGRGGCLGAFA